jgi:hypothetical protein
MFTYFINFPTPNMPKMGAENSYLPCITKSTEEKIELSPVYHKRIKQNLKHVLVLCAKPS